MKNISQEEPHDNGNGPTERDFGSVPSDIDAPADDTMVRIPIIHKCFTFTIASILQTYEPSGLVGEIFSRARFLG